MNVVSRRQFLKLCYSILAAVGTVQLTGQMPAGGARYPEIPVLLYHRIGYTSGHLTTTPEQFASDLVELQRQGFTTISLDQFRSFLQEREPTMPDRPLLITFDDGYRDNYENAFPILQKFSMKGAFFIITGTLGEPNRITSSQILEMAHWGMSFGSHTVSHRPLGELAEEQAWEELTVSKSVLEDLMGRSVDFIAYPKGNYNQTTLELARQAGYAGGFSIIRGTCAKSSQPFVLRRIPLFSYDKDVMAAMAKRAKV